MYVLVSACVWYGGPVCGCVLMCVFEGGLVCVGMCVHMCVGVLIYRGAGGFERVCWCV